MTWFKPQTVLDKTFEIGIILKGLDGLVEITGAALLLLVSSATIDRFTTLITKNELDKDPNDFIATHILQYSHELTNGSRVFAIAFLLSHGFIKVVLVVGLLRSLAWAYPFAFVTLGAFIVYQLYRIAVHPTFGMIFLTIFDAFIVWLTWREYQKFKRGELIPKKIS